MTEKKKKPTTIQVSIETKGKLDSIMADFEEILSCNVSYDSILRILLALREKEIITLV